MACQAALDAALRCPLPGPPCCLRAARGARTYGATISAAAIGIAHAASGQVQNGVRRAATAAALPANAGRNRGEKTAEYSSNRRSGSNRTESSIHAYPVVTHSYYI